jgi:hypothetical protein
VGRVVEAVLPARMGTPFRWLVGSSWVGNLGDGIALAAGPLLVAGQTQDPFLVALGALVQRLPWLLLGLQRVSSPTASTAGGWSSAWTWPAAASSSSS